ncbi:MAG: YjfB family protein [Nitrospinae bacterium]|nr:YjfB family protein [Nitrospinota bacterium]
MQVASSAGADVQAAMDSKLQKTANDVSVGVAKKAMDAEKDKGDQLVDMIKKAGSSIDVTA